MYLSQKQNCKYWYLQREEPSPFVENREHKPKQRKRREKVGRIGRNSKFRCVLLSLSRWRSQFRSQSPGCVNMAQRMSLPGDQRRKGYLDSTETFKGTGKQKRCKLQLNLKPKSHPGENSKHRLCHFYHPSSLVSTAVTRQGLRVGDRKWIAWKHFEHQHRTGSCQLLQKVRFLQGFHSWFSQPRSSVQQGKLICEYSCVNIF